MLGKLLKHELYATGRIMLPALGALVLLSGMANLSYRGFDSSESVLVHILLGFTISLFFIGLVAAGVLVVVILVRRFYKNLLGDEGYLMLTLPVSVHSLIWSKLLAACLWIFVTGLVCTGLFTLSVFHFASLGFADFMGFLPDMRQALDELFAAGYMTPGDLTGYIVELLLFSLLACINQYLHFYAAMALGCHFTKHKLLLSVAFYLAISFGIRLLSLPFSQLFQRGFFTIDSVYQLAEGLHRLSISGIAGALIQAALLYLLTWLPLKKGINLG